MVIFHDFCHLLTFFKINFFKRFFQEHSQSVKHFGSRSGSKLRSNCCKDQQKTTNSLLAGKCLIIVGSKIYENSCKQKYKLFQVMGTLYRYLSIYCPKLQYDFFRYLPVSMKNSIVLLLSIFEVTVLAETCGLSYIVNNTAPSLWERSCSVVECLWWVEASSVSLHCVFEQDILILAKYWFNSGRRVPTQHKNCLLGRKESNQSNKSSFSGTLWQSHRSVVLTTLFFLRTLVKSV